MCEVVNLDEHRAVVLWRRYEQAREACRRAPSEAAMLAAFRILHQWREASKRAS